MSQFAKNAKHGAYIYLTSLSAVVATTRPVPTDSPTKVLYARAIIETGRYYDFPRSISGTCAAQRRRQIAITFSPGFAPIDARPILARSFVLPMRSAFSANVAHVAIRRILSRCPPYNSFG